MHYVTQVTEYDPGMAVGEAPAPDRVVFQMSTDHRPNIEKMLAALKPPRKSPTKKAGKV